MDVREKLVELIKDGIRKGLRAKGDDRLDYSFEDVADHLIAKGVTVQEWIPVTERLPDRTMPPHDVLVYHDLNCGMFIDRAWYSHEKNKWRSAVGMNLKVTHWMPLPEPPKGE